MAKRIQFARTGDSEVLELVDTPAAEPGPGEVRVANEAVGLNFIDIYFRTGLYPAPSLPSGLGTEGAGVVDAVGEGVDHLQVGDRVAYAQGPLGAYAELHTLPADKVVALPEGISCETAAGAMLKGLTVQYLLRQTYPLQGGETILFHAAAGGVGSIACQWAKALGVKLIGTVSSVEKAELAKRNGAWATIDYTKEDVVERVRELTGGEMVDVVYDSVGKDTWETSLDCLKPRGLMVSFGNASGPVEGVNIGILNQKGALYVTRPSLNGYADSPERLQDMADELFDMIESGKVKIDVAQRFALAEAGKAQDALASRKTTGSTVLLP
ncbi:MULTISPECIES: NADPH:quinone reductase [Halomonas]|uniref:Quinone oxidoreductase n=1 Tax=Halomonas litopenaei TaxID=2109328 RepID=A0ABX5IWN4_9GAMM|nr:MULTISPECIES: NADPH:quinone reductase [Halomonas]MBR9770151.1 NADPH:quinone reductase [Gammaproteobacteria bacterium]KJZ06385.1 quinone oxidoreductase [Halomonas sp. S2151]MAR73299.1 quinone oxidoreductase [Halomonas sp.]MBR9880983.1 NADPH:quinone reductase [Gammaproteobacteria bacterium]MBY5941229.1 NADPH:quinone reductase [Halomonas sp. DP5N14-9]|tara:strand:+ start:4826 stop:5803 length:978 start_codon:yes stop_codon:yes gene_type:complete